ncbi:hypothetical protein KFK09_003973 [Dendrobium nobile]|uniref:RNase H type-1 domain-containing protein n=1 Tax=Dendrobium nobile TaxID=94219 RepID=A0A8T3BZ54_DENNO|nr:hypothetical protein KFK09_003973 [Dendrobium nobile]
MYDVNMFGGVLDLEQCAYDVNDDSKTEGQHNINDGQLKFEEGLPCKTIVRWTVGDGKAINVYEDIWVLDKSFQYWPTFVKQMKSNSLLVENFLKNGVWNTLKLKEFFGEELIKLISSTILREGEDHLELIYKLSGKTLSTLVAEALLNEIMESSPSTQFDKMKLNLRIKLFWWKLIDNAIPTYHFLYFRRLQGYDKCPRGCDEVENIGHIIFGCMKIKEVIAVLNKWGFGIESANQPLWLLNSWHSPPPDWIKVNIDASLHNSYKAGIGGVFRDNYGWFLLAFENPLIHWDAVAVELQAILALKLVIKDWMLNYKGLIIEGDNMNVINFIKVLVNKGGNESFDISFIKRFDYVIFNCVDRGSNKLADLCANFACFSSFMCNNVSLSDIPPSFINLLEKELDACRV